MRTSNGFWYSLLLPFFLCLALCISGCTEATAPVSGSKAPAISGNDVGGEYFSLGLQKQKLVVLYFWSRNCCGDSLKQLEPVYQKYSFRGLSVVGIENGSAADDILGFVKQNRITFVNLTDERGLLARAYQVAGFPTIFLIGGDGVIQRKIGGEIHPEQLEKLIVQLLPR